MYTFLYISSPQTFFAEGAVKLCNIFAGTPFLSVNDMKVFFCYDGYTIVAKAATLRIVQSV
jgi:hypothetical protein